MYIVDSVRSSFVSMYIVFYIHRLVSLYIAIVVVASFR